MSEGAKLVAFDFFGVIGNDLFDNWVEANGLEESKRQLRKSLVDPADLGVLSFQEECEGLGAAVGRSWRSVRSEMLAFSSIDRDVVHIAWELSERQIVAVCSNAPSGLLEQIFCFHNVNFPAKHLIVSGNLGARKPEPKIFNELASQAGVRLSQCVLIDDREENVTGARSLGMTGITYKTPRHLQIILSEIGLLTKKHD